jgi:hypothetical protein
MSPGFLLGSQLISSLGSPKTSTLTGIVVDRDWSGRTFNIPDCPSKQSVGTLKAWYIRNICPTATPSILGIVRDTGAVVDEDIPFWQLAEGEGQFRVAIVHLPPERPPSPVEMITLYVQHEAVGISTALRLPVKYTLLQLKIATFEQLGLGDATAALNPRVCFTFQGQILDNEATIHASHLSDGDRIVIGERHSPPCSYRGSRTPSPTQENTQYNCIADIWATGPQTPQQESPQMIRRKKSNDSKTKSQTELEKMKSSYRTKMCRAGAGACKYGNSCWFAHTPEDLRKPSDPLPAHCPGVSKLEKYAKRQDCP